MPAPDIHDHKVVAFQPLTPPFVLDAARKWGAERDAQQARLNTLHRGNPARAKAALD